MPKISNTADSKIAVLGIDLGKNTFHAIGLDMRGKIIFKRKFTRGALECQSAPNFDPGSACNTDPYVPLSSDVAGVSCDAERNSSPLQHRRARQERCLKRQLSLPVSTMSQ